MKTEYNYEDQSLLLAIKNGNEKAFDTLFRKYYPMLCAYGNKFVELEDAEECVQDAMLWLWENKDMLVIQSSLSNYLFSIVHHRAINRIKQQEVKSRVENYFYEEMQSLIDDTNFYLIEELTIGEFYQFNLSSCIRQQNSLTAQFVSFSLANLANIFYPPNFYNN